MRFGLSLLPYLLAPPPLASFGFVPRRSPADRPRLGGKARSRHWPHQGYLEVARRKHQIDAGKLQVTDESDAMRSLRLARTDIASVRDVA